MIQGANSPLPGDQAVLSAIQTAAEGVFEALKGTDSGAVEEECITRMRKLMQRVLDAREKCAWGDYVRPSQQHVEGPDVSAFSTMIDIDRSLSKQERHEMELLAKQQDELDDPMGCVGLMESLAMECSKRVGDFDTKVREVENVHIATLQKYESAVDQVMTRISTDKTSRVVNEFDANIAKKEVELTKLKGELSDVLSRVTRTLQEINELHVCKAELNASLQDDHAAHAQTKAEIAAQMRQLQVYKQTLERRKSAIKAVGEMEQTVLTHVQALLLQRGKDLFEGRESMLMRQFEVLPNVYCQCAVLDVL